MRHRSAQMSVAVCHEWVLSRAGSEQVAARIASALDAHDVFTYTAIPALAEALFPGCNVHTSRIGRLAVVQRHGRWLLPLMSTWWKRIDLADHDVVVTSSHATVNSIRVGATATHICYCSTPMRYAWMWRSELSRFPRWLRWVWPLIAALLRRGDARRARNVHTFIANSREVANRIERFYGRSSVIIYPPVDTRFFTPDPTVAKEDFYLYAGRLVAYKRPEDAVLAAGRAGVRLIVAGSGPELERLRGIASPLVEFREAPTSEELRDLYRRARALVFPGLEDFGMVMIEAQACGTPVIALDAGGARDAVRSGETGSLYPEQKVEALALVLRSFDPAKYDAHTLRGHAERFGHDRFDREISELVEATTADARHATA